MPCSVIPRPFELRLQFVDARNGRAHAESFLCVRTNFKDILDRSISSEELKLKYESCNANIKLADKRKKYGLILASDRNCSIAQS